MDGKDWESILANKRDVMKHYRQRISDPSTKAIILIRLIFFKKKKNLFIMILINLNLPPPTICSPGILRQIFLYIFIQKKKIVTGMQIAPI